MAEDVFLTAPPSARGLSPTAEVFTPRLPSSLMPPKKLPTDAYYDEARYTPGVSTSLRELAPVLLPDSLTLGQAHPYQPFEYFPNGVPADRYAHTNAAIRRQGYGVIDIKQVPFVNVKHIYVHDFSASHGTFTTDEGFSRTFQASGVPLDISSEEIKRQFPVSLPYSTPILAENSHSQVERFPSITGINATELLSGLFVVHCSDIRDAEAAAALTHKILPFSIIMPYTEKKYAEQTGRNVDLATDYEGQMIIKIHYNPNSTVPVQHAPVLAEIKRLLAQVGDVKAFHTSNITGNNFRECRMEFYNADHVAVGVDLLSGTVCEVCQNVARLTPLLISSGWCCSPSGAVPT